MPNRDHDSNDTGRPPKRRRTRSPSPLTAVAMAEAKRQAEMDAMDVGDEEFEFDEDDNDGAEEEFAQEMDEHDDDEDVLEFEDIALPPAPQGDTHPLDADTVVDEGEDEDDDLAFEDITIPPTNPPPMPASDFSIPIPTNLSTIEFTLPLNPSDSQASSNSQKKRRAITKADRIARLTLHRMHLLSLLSSAHLAHKAVSVDDTVHALVLSLIPPPVATAMRLGSDHVRLGPLITWLRSEFTADPMLPWPDGADTVAIAITNRVGHPCTLVLAVAALLWHVVGVKARLVAGLNPIPLTFQGQTAQPSVNDSADPQSSTAAPSSTTAKSCREVVVEKAATIYPLAFALEVPKGHGEWTPLHFNWTVIDHMTPTTTSAYARATASSRSSVTSDTQPHPFDTLKSSGGPYFTSPYVVALAHPPRLSRTSIPRAKDVSVRYLTGLRGGRPVEDPKFRVPLDDPWWSQLVSTGAAGSTAGATAGGVEDQYMLEQLLVNAPFPTRLADYKDHRVYALERHLRKDEVVYPKEPVLGKIKGEMIYPRANVKQVRSERVWVRQFGRQVKAGERPVKESKARGGKGKGADIEQESQETLAGTVALFGEWQTEPYVATAEVDPVTGEVPTNEHGNVELFHPCMVPKGGVHVTVPNAKRIAKDLAIPYAEAMTGFDFASGGRTRPTIHGIVVAALTAGIIEEAAANLAAAQHEQEMASRKHQIAMRWVMFAKGLVAREQVKRLFARTGARPASSAESQGGSHGSADQAAAESEEGDSDVEVVGPRLRRRPAPLSSTAAPLSDLSSVSGDDDVADPEAGGFVVPSDSESQTSSAASDSESRTSDSESEEEWDSDLGPRARRRRPPPRARSSEAQLAPSFDEGGGGFM